MSGANVTIPGRVMLVGRLESPELQNHLGGIGMQIMRDDGSVLLVAGITIDEARALAALLGDPVSVSVGGAA